MERFILKKSVQILGTDFWGRKAGVTLEPTGSSGWFWRLAHEDVPLAPELVKIAHHRLVLRFGEHVMHVFEHLGALRFTGLDGIRIVQHSAWLPYDGRAKLYWRSVEPHLRSDGMLRPMQRAARGIVTSTRKMSRRVEGTFGGSDTFSASVRIAYPKWGEARIAREIPGESLAHIFEARPLAQPTWLRPVGCAAKSIWWPHFDNVLWPHDMPAQSVARELARHRLLDLLGALSVIPRAGEFLTGTVESDCGNHAADVQLLQAIQGQLA